MNIIFKIIFKFISKLDFKLVIIFATSISIVSVRNVSISD